MYFVVHIKSKNFKSRSKLQRDKDRDISEKIALGMPSAGGSQETMYDQRLFNQSKVCLCSLFNNRRKIMFVLHFCLTITGR